MQVRRNVLPNSQEQQQRTKNATFFRNLITKANEHSKKLTLIDTFMYFILMAGLITIMIVRSDIANFCVEAMAYVTTACVSLRLGYSAKSAIENYQKILKTSKNKEEEDYSEEEETLG